MMTPSGSYVRTSAMVTVPVLAVAISVYMFIIRPRSKPANYHPSPLSEGANIKEAIPERLETEVLTDIDSSDNESISNSNRMRQNTEDIEGLDISGICSIPSADIPKTNALSVVVNPSESLAEESTSSISSELIEVSHEEEKKLINSDVIEDSLKHAESEEVLSATVESPMIPDIQTASAIDSIEEIASSILNDTTNEIVPKESEETAESIHIDGKIHHHESKDESLQPDDSQVTDETVLIVPKASMDDEVPQGESSSASNVMQLETSMPTEHPELVEDVIDSINLHPESTIPIEAEHTTSDAEYLSDDEHTYDAIYGHMHDTMSSPLTDYRSLSHASEDPNDDHFISASPSPLRSTTPVHISDHDAHFVPTALDFHDPGDGEWALHHNQEVDDSDYMTKLIRNLEDEDVGVIMRGVDRVVQILKDLDFGMHIHDSFAPDDIPQPNMYAEVDNLLSRDFLNKLLPLCEHENSVVVKGCLRMISEWLNSSLPSEYIDKIALNEDPDIMQMILDVIDYNDNSFVKRDALWIVAKIIGFDNKDYLENLVNLGLVNVLTMYLHGLVDGSVIQAEKQSKDSVLTSSPTMKSATTALTTVVVILTCLEGMLSHDQDHRYCVLLKENNVENILDNLQSSKTLPWIQSDEDIMHAIERIRYYMKRSTI